MRKYTLIIAEKPEAALRIATALDKEENPIRMFDNGVPYYIAARDRKIVVVPALGHLYTITGDQLGRSYPVFNFKWVPRYVAERKAIGIRKWLHTITKLAEQADIFIDACDYDVEGCIIGYCILKYACKDKEQISRRMKFSTLTKQDIEKAYKNLLPHLDFSQIEAGLTRHEVDWLYGINLSRALMLAIKNASGNYATFSTGRVQGPTLKFLVDREKAIVTFVPTPYWKVKALVEIHGQIFEAKYEKEVVEGREEAETVVSTCLSKKGEVEEIDVRKVLQAPPCPFDLGTLQNEAYRLFKYTPQRTLSVAQQLYLSALISYPRTDSQRLPAAIGYEAILRNLGRIEQYKKLTKELLAKKTLRPKEGKKDDPAHPAIYPTGKQPEKTFELAEKRILDLVIRRFLAVFGEPAVKQNVSISIMTDGNRFYLTGSQMLRRGWMRFYDPHVRFQDLILPPLEKGQIIDIQKVFLESRFTEPPSRYNPSSLLRKMEQAEIGTKATRANIIKTLRDRGYVQGEHMTVTTLGSEVCRILEAYCPTVVSTSLTRELEKSMLKIQDNQESRDNVLAEATGILKPVLEALKQNEEAIGQQLAEALRTSRLEGRALGACPVCKSGKLVINYSKKTRKRFIGCTNYFKGLCNISFPIPQKGAVKPSRKTCVHCGWPTIETRIGRRHWVLCFNADCPSKSRGK